MFQGTQQHGVEKSFRVTRNLYKKCHPVITWNKKHSSKQVLPVRYTLKKTIFEAAIFKGLRVISFQTEQKIIVIYFGVCESYLHFQKIEDQINTVYEK